MGRLPVITALKEMDKETLIRIMKEPKNAILKQLDDIKSGNISDVEFSAAQKSIANHYRQLLDSPFDIQAFLENRALFGITDDLEISQRKLSKVTKQDVIDVASRIKLCSSVFIEGKETRVEEDEND